MVWAIAAAACLFLLLCAYGVFYVIVQWILSDAPVGTKVLWISNGKRPPANAADKPEQRSARQPEP
jgi:hypothetical protein